VISNSREKILQAFFFFFFFFFFFCFGHEALQIGFSLRMYYNDRIGVKWKKELWEGFVLENVQEERGVVPCRLNF
jgi:hypothetical protein